MDEKAASSRLDELLREIARHDRLYYVVGEPEISDREYDRLMEELLRLEAEFPELVTLDSPSKRVGGAALTEFRAVPHAVPMLSLGNTYSASELLEFDARVHRFLSLEGPIAYLNELKIDGVAIELIYEDGRFVQG